MSGLVRQADDPYRAQLELLAEHDLHATSWGARALMKMEPARREELAGWLEDFDVRLVMGIGFDWLSGDPEVVKQGTDQCLAALETLAGPMRVAVCSTGISRNVHHYSRSPSVAEQIDRLSQTMAPVAEAAWQAGCPIGIHKVTHFGTDLAELCSRTPHLGVELDTGNAFLVGELPLAAAEATAPYIVATHFKDHYVEPGFGPLRLQIRGAVPGSGDAELRSIYDVIVRDTPNADDLVMLMEIDPVEGLTQQQALSQAVEFIHTL